MMGGQIDNPPGAPQFSTQICGFPHWVILTVLIKCVDRKRTISPGLTRAENLLLSSSCHRTSLHVCSEERYNHNNSSGASPTAACGAAVVRELRCVAGAASAPVGGCFAFTVPFSGPVFSSPSAHRGTHHSLADRKAELVLSVAAGRSCCWCDPSTRSSPFLLSLPPSPPRTLDPIRLGS